jgi:anti-sigma B factor antagonist
METEKYAAMIPDFRSLRHENPVTLRWRQCTYGSVFCYLRKMALEHFDWEVGGVVVLHLQGSLTLGEGTHKFRELIHETLEAGKKNILLNMAEVYYIDSSGLGELVAAYTTTNHRGGKLKLMKLTQRVQDVVQLTKVHRVFEVFSDEDSAVKSFGA